MEINRQYIGARYVPKFATPTQWDKTQSYEALTIVTNLGNSYTSKKPVPPNVELNNEEYWALTGNFNAQIESYRKEVADLNKSIAYVIREPENSDITELLNEKLQEGNVALDGKSYKITHITIPNYHTLYGNNSLLTVTGTADVAVSVGASEHSTFVDNYANTAIHDTTIQCNNKSNGIFVYGQGSVINNVVVLQPKSYGFKIGVANKSSDCNINNCRVNGICDYGFVVDGMDNYFTECRTLFCKKASFQNNGGGNYFTLCHALGVESNTDGFDNCSGFELNTNTIIRDCYADNCRYGVYAPITNEHIIIDGMFCFWYEYRKEIERVGILINGSSNSDISNVICDNSNPNVKRMKIQSFLNWAPMSNFHISFDMRPDTRYDSNDASLLADFNRNGKNYMVGKTAGYNVICGYQNFYGDNQYSHMCNFNVTAENFAIKDVALHITGNSVNDPRGLYTASKGKLIADSTTAAKVEIALLKKDTDLFIAFKILDNTIDYLSAYIVDGSGPNCMYCPPDGIDLSTATVITKYTITNS